MSGDSAAQEGRRRVAEMPSLRPLESRTFEQMPTPAGGPRPFAADPASDGSAQVAGAVLASKAPGRAFPPNDLDARAKNSLGAPPPGAKAVGCLIGVSEPEV